MKTKVMAPKVKIVQIPKTYARLPTVGSRAEAVRVLFAF